MQFDDGDRRHRVPRVDVMSVAQFIDAYGEEQFKLMSGIDLKACKRDATEEDQGCDGTPEEDSKTQVSEREEEEPATKKRSIGHPLIDAFVLREWLDVSLNKRRLYGQVKSCRKIVQTRKALEFEIEYSDESLKRVKELLPEWRIEPREFLEEAYTWGYCEAFAGRDNFVVPQGTPVWRWIVPDCVVDTPSFPPKRRLVVTQKNIAIDLEVKPSSIPNAGFGLFAKASPLTQTPPGQRCCLLKYGEIIDLGVYSPVSHQDRRPNSAVFAKSFIFDGRPEEWVYGEKEVGHVHSYDITDDTTGRLHEQAKRNCLVFANETDGKEQTSVHAQRDPFSHVHYVLGPERESEQLSLPFNDEWFELKLDYKEGFEPTRIRQGYSRLPKGPRRKEVEDTGIKTVEVIEDWSFDEIKAAVAYITNLDLMAISLRAKVRTLVVALCLRAQLDHFDEVLDQNRQLGTLVSEILDLVTNEELHANFEAIRGGFTNKDLSTNDARFSEFLVSHVGVASIESGFALKRAIRRQVEAASSN